MDLVVSSLQTPTQILTFMCLRRTHKVEAAVLGIFFHRVHGYMVERFRHLHDRTTRENPS